MQRTQAKVKLLLTWPSCLLNRLIESKGLLRLKVVNGQCTEDIEIDIAVVSFDASCMTLCDNISIKWK